MGPAFSRCVRDGAVRTGSRRDPVKATPAESRLFECCRTEPLTTDYLALCLEAHDADVADARGLTPLHALCENSSVTPELLRLLLAGCPENARRVHLELGTPLHCLCANARVDTALLAELLRANAAATEVRDGAGRTPLRKLCDNATDRKAECLPLVLEASPEFVVAEMERRLDALHGDAAAAQNPPRKRPVVIPRGAEEVFESTGGAPKRPAAIPEAVVAPAAAGKRGDSVIHRSGWARELFTSPQRVTGRGRAADADILDHLRALGDDDLRSLSHEELMDLLADFEAELSEAQLATVAAIIDEYDDDDDADEAAPEDVDVGEAPAAPEDAATSPLH